MSVLLVGDRLLDLSRRELLDERGKPIDLRNQSLNVLICLARGAGAVVSKEEIVEEVWKGIAVTDDSIVQCISEIRRALGEAGKSNLKTLPRRGYRLTVDGGQHDAQKIATQKQQDNPSTHAEIEAVTLAPTRPSIAVLPFVTSSKAPDHDALAEGISEDIITALSRISWFFVIARTSSFSYTSRSIGVRDIAKELGVRYILEGSLRSVGTNLRVAVNLIDATSQTCIWAEKYDFMLSNLFETQDEICRKIVASLHTQIQLKEGSFQSFETTTPQRDPPPVWMQLNRAWSNVYQMTSASLKEACGIAKLCLDEHPNSSRAHQILASALFHQAWMGYSKHPLKDYADSLNAAEKAVSYNDRNEYAHWILGLCCMATGDHDRALFALKQSLYINPNCSLAYGSLATVQNYAGLPDLAISNNEYAIQINPRDPSIFYRFTGLALSNYLEDRLDVAITWARKAVAAKPSFLQAHLFLIASLAEAGMSKEASLALKDLKAIHPNTTLNEARELPFRQAADGEKLMKSLKLSVVE